VTKSGDIQREPAASGPLNFFGLTRDAKRLLAAAGLMHIVLAVLLFTIGRAQLVPSLISRDGIVESFAVDSYKYQEGAIRLAGVLQHEGIRAWVLDREATHVKLISLHFLGFGWATGATTLSIEPLNLLSYLAILVLVMMIGRELAGERAGLIAAGVVALWPTFLLHTTQILKDPLFIAGGLSIVLIVTTWVTRNYQRRGALILSAAMAALILLLLLIRLKFGIMILMVVIFGLAALSVRQFRERRLRSWNWLCPLLSLSIVALAPFFLQNYFRTEARFKLNPPRELGPAKTTNAPDLIPSIIFYGETATRANKQLTTEQGAIQAAAGWVGNELATTRHLYNISYANSGSSIDRDVDFAGLRDIMIYLPRAFEIGMWAPFPKSWTNPGKRVGRAGVILSAAETFAIYLCQLLALTAVFAGHRRLAAWLLLFLAISGSTLLGLIITNVGSLYRFRYLFWMLFIILGVKGLVIVTAWVRERRRLAISQAPQMAEA
jgi:hypothetical protein